MLRDGGTALETTGYSAGAKVTEGQIADWAEQFHRDGCLFIPNVLPPDWMKELRADLERALPERGRSGGGIEIAERMFELSAANLRLFDVEPIVSLAEALIDG